ncbi:hypothetical protein BSKO_12769 [Bryopsis sp. KO-2023]|nr:hypothetical protein BSKO_12769 [Bryopsis sp. KO-2023]
MSRSDKCRQRLATALFCYCLWNVVSGVSQRDPNASVLKFADPLDGHKRDQRKLRSETSYTKGAKRRLHSQECSEAVELSEIAPTVETESKVYDTRWVGVEDQYLYLITIGPPDIYGGRVWRSFDAGDTFTDMTPALIAALPDDAYEKTNEAGVADVFVNPKDPKDIIIQGAGRYHWVSNDYGKSVRAVETPGKTIALSHRLNVHPTFSDWALTLVRRDECEDDELAYSHMCAKDLFLTQDAWGEMKWTNLTEQSNGRIAAFIDYEWGVAATENDSDTAVPMKVIFATVYERPEHLKGPYAGWDKDVHFVRSDDFFQTGHIKVKECGNQFEILAGNVFLGVPNSCPVDLDGKKRKLPENADALSGVSLYVSQDIGASFQEACVPTVMNQDGYSLVVTHDDDGAFVIIDHKLGGKKGRRKRDTVTNVYASGEHAALYTLSLSDSYEDPYGYGLDFARVEGISGVYIANQEIWPGKEGLVIDKMESSFLSTKISYDGGASWQKIPAPTSFNHKEECDKCNGVKDCFLNLHMASSWHWDFLSNPALYTHSNAPGVMMASGIVSPVGSGMHPNEGTCTWLSTDGGVSWQDVGAGAQIYEYGDHGGILIMAKYTSEGPTSEVRFSVDDGKCWERIPLKTALKVDNIRIEPDGQRPRFILHGTACSKADHSKCSMSDGESNQDVKGIVYTIDIQNMLNLRACDRGDYEDWQPPKCVLGSERQIEKRKAESRCLSGGAYVRPSPRITPCSCTDLDVECDYGWVRKESNDDHEKLKRKCMKIPEDDLPECKVVDDGEYEVSELGKRFVHGDNCTVQFHEFGEFFGDTDGKGGRIRGSHHKKARSGAFPFMVWTLVIGAVCCVGAVMYRFAPPHVKDRVEEVTTPVAEVFNSAFSWAKDKVVSPRIGGDGGGVAMYQPLSDAISARP